MQSIASFEVLVWSNRNDHRPRYPEQLGADPANPKIYHTFSRIHGDMERDYNYFQIDASYFSQGPGNFRDVNQNRRVDNMQVPAVSDFNLRMFLGFVQSDGYNPLTVQSVNFHIPRPDNVRANDTSVYEAILDGTVEKKDWDKMINLLSHPFRPGQLFVEIKFQKLKLLVDNKDFLNTVIDAAEVDFAGELVQRLRTWRRCLTKRSS